jgi:monomeric sarcosine oxidase
LSTTRCYDAIIIGGGTMGTAAALALARRGLKLLVLEQFTHVHDKGSHGGETRIIRHVYAESPEYVPLVQQADRLWLGLEAETKERLLVRCGGLELAAPGFSHARRARASADEHDIPYEWLPPHEVNTRWPALRVPDDWDALYAPSSGFLLAAEAIRAMGAVARSHGATIREDTPVLAWGEDDDGVWVTTPGERFTADTLVVTAGAWAGRMLGDLGLPLEILRKTLWWQKVADLSLYDPARFPIFVTDSDAGEIYGFPIHGTPGLKIANHATGEPADPETVDRVAHPGENADCLELAARVLPGVGPHVIQSAVCLYAMTPDTDFIVDRYPGSARVAIGAGFSGHGFKFAPAIGELLADLVTRPTARTLPRLSVSRLATAIQGDTRTV